jgi:hypothetical protein
MICAKKESINRTGIRIVFYFFYFLYNQIIRYRFYLDDHYVQTPIFMILEFQVLA